MNVSVIIPAYNAADTLERAVKSVLDQGYEAWEAVVVDDGSTDETLAVARELAGSDERIRVVEGPHEGVSGARNRGVREADHDWLLFLDADDRITPDHLQLMTDALLATPGADVAHCGSVFKTPEGVTVYRNWVPFTVHPFEILGRYCVHHIHAVVVRRAVVEEVGGFDTSLAVGEDWDLWARVSRSGATYRDVPAFLAETWVRRGSASDDAWELFRGLVQVLERTHAPDPRVSHPVSRYRDGLPSAELPGSRLLAACWPAGMLIGTGQDPAPILEALPGDRDPAMDPAFATHTLLSALMRSAYRPPEECLELWPLFGPAIHEFLSALEEKSGSPHLARRAGREVERMVIRSGGPQEPTVVGRSFSTPVHLEEPLQDLRPPEGCQEVTARLMLEGELLGLLEAPVVGGRVEARVLADGVSDQVGWEVLGRFFQSSVYPSLRVQRDRRQVSVWRGGLALVEGEVDPGTELEPMMHAHLGWTVFLQELWGRPDWPHQRFYDRSFEEDTSRRLPVEEGRIRIEVSEDLPELATRGGTVEVVPAVGGEDLGLVRVPSPGGRVSSHQLRVAISFAGGYELCRAAVRNGILGRPLDYGRTLRERLAEAARNRRSERDPGPGGDAGSGKGKGGEGYREPEGGPGTEASMSPDDDAGRPWLLGRRNPYVFGLPSSRRITLPAGAAPALETMVRVTGEPLVPGSPESRECRYAPDHLGSNPTPAGKRVIPASRPSRGRPARGSGVFHLARRILRRAQGALRGMGASRPTPTQVFTEALPVLMYHRVAAGGAPGSAGYRVSPRQFEEQLRHLRQAGYRSVSQRELLMATAERKPLPGSRVMLTFDDGYLDFLTDAWPLLQRYGFGATVFLVADRVGESNVWDQELGETIPLLGWDQIRELAAQGVEFGSHTCTHPFLGALSPEEVVEEGARSRWILQEKLGAHVWALAYPYGNTGPAIQQWMGGCGYEMGFTARTELWRPYVQPLAIPRIHVSGHGDIHSFRESLPALDLPVEEGTLE